MGRRRKPHPVLENLEILRAGSEGKSIAKFNDMVVFVTGVVPGDIVDIQVNRKKSKFYEGYPIKFHSLSDKRVEPVCKHFGTCGGCKWQSMAYKEQLFYKQQQVIDNLTRIGGLELPEINPILASDETTFYRNKLEYTFSNKRWLSPEEMETTEIFERNALGFHVPKRFDKVLDIEKCHLQPDPSNQIRLAVRNFALEKGYSFFDLREQVGLLRQLTIRNTLKGDFLVIVHFFTDEPEIRDALFAHLIPLFPQVVSWTYVINGKKNDTIADLEIITYHGEDHLLEEMEGLSFKIGPKSFYQTNPLQAYLLYKVTRNMAGLTGNEVVYDLYTGTGTIANFVAAKAKKVVGIEYVPEAIEDAHYNSKINGINNTSFYAGDMKDLLTSDFFSENGQPEVIITDPPRAGMHESVSTALVGSGAHTIVYVSCNPATQARDLSLLADVYEIAEIQPVDMFPQTHHVENVVKLVKKGS